MTTVSLNPQRLAAEAVDLLLGLVNQRRDIDRERLVAHDLIVRESTRPPRAAEGPPRP